MNKLNLIVLIALISFFSTLLKAETTPVTEDFTELGEVQVWSEPFAQKMGTQKLNSEEIEKLPTGNGSISELLQNNPNVQFSSSSSTSQNQGEIAPENVSFHGERFYNNAWMIDGLSNNDNINPGSNNGSLSALDAQAPFNLPDGGTQSFWINSDIIDSVDVYDSNISAKFGQFTGGVIDAKLMSPDTDEAWGSVSYRTTRDEWTNFHFESEEDKTEFEKSNRLYNQSQFTKHIFSTNINQPLSDSAAILFSYNRTQSDIPFYHDYRQSWEDQNRLAETYLLKGLYEADNGDTWTSTFIYSPHTSSYVFQDVQDGNYAVKGGGYRFSMDWEHLFNVGVVTSTIAYMDTENSTDYRESDYYSWILTDSIDWQSADDNAQEGGLGNVVTDKQTLTLKQDYELDLLQLGQFKHKWVFGWQADIANAGYKRKTKSNFYTSTGSLAPSSCYENDSSCIAGEQAANYLITFEKSDVQVSNNHYALYLQDQIQWRRFEFTSGLRVDFDEFLGNVDIAPRLTASYDLFGNNDTVIFAGANRYYADSLLSYALSAEKGNAVRYTRNNYDAGWIFDADRTYGGTYLTSDLNTPYSDELNLGIAQKYQGTEWTIKWVNRRAKDQFSRETITNESNQNSYLLSNNGTSEADSFTLDVRLLKPFIWQSTATSFSLGGNYVNKKSNFTSYDPGHLFSDDFTAYADGEVVSIDEIISRNDYNQPWTVFTQIDFSLIDLGVHWTQNYRYTAGYRSYEDSGDNYTCNESDSSCNGTVGSVDIYEEIIYSDRFVADWRFTYILPIKETQLALTLDVLNVFDSKVEGSALDGTGSVLSYKPGRRFWLGGKFSW